MFGTDATVAVGSPRISFVENHKPFPQSFFIFKGKRNKTIFFPWTI